MKRKRAASVLLVMAVMLCLLGCSGNKDGDDPFDFSGVEPKDMNPWTYIANTSLSGNGAIRDLAASSGNLGVVIGITGIVFSIFWMVVRVCFSRSPAAREEIKQEAMLKGMIAILIFSIPFWLGLFKQFSELLV